MELKTASSVENLLPVPQEWNPTQSFHSTKTETPNQPNLEAVESVDKFIELGSKVVVAVSTAWWAMCELVDYIKLKSTEREMTREGLINQPKRNEEDDVQ